MKKLLLLTLITSAYTVQAHSETCQLCHSSHCSKRKHCNNPDCHCHNPHYSDDYGPVGTTALTTRDIVKHTATLRPVRVVEDVAYYPGDLFDSIF